MNNIYSTLVILGSGPAGLTAAIYASRLNIDTLLINNIIGGQLSLTYNIENWPGILENISGYNLCNNMLIQAKKFNTNVISDYIIEVNFDINPFILYGEKNTYTCISLIIATGCISKKINVPGENEYIGKGISTCAICDGMFFKNKDIAIIGGGNTAIEEAIYLSDICSKVYIICRKNKFKADFINIKKLYNLKNKNIIIYKNNNIIGVYGDKYNIDHIKIKNLNEIINNIKISGLFIAIGYYPNTKIFLNKINLTKSYHIKININEKSFTSTNIKGVFAAGDVIDPIYKQAITASAFGCMAAIDVKNYLDKII